MTTTKQTGGVSLAKGPVALIGALLLAYGVTAFIMGGHSFALHPLSGTVTGKTWLGIDVNAWSSLLFIGAGVLLLVSAPAHWAAKTMSLIVGLMLVAAALIALYDKHDVLGVFAANGPTRLVWGLAGIVLILLSRLPRVGRNDAPAATPARFERAPARRVHSDISRDEEAETAGSRAAGSDDRRVTTPDERAPDRREPATRRHDR